MANGIFKHEIKVFWQRFNIYFYLLVLAYFIEMLCLTSPEGMAKLGIKAFRTADISLVTFIIGTIYLIVFFIVRFFVTKKPVNKWITAIISLPSFFFMPMFGPVEGHFSTAGTFLFSLCMFATFALTYGVFCNVLSFRDKPIKEEATQ